MTRSDCGPTLYEGDFFTWTQDQAKALRAMPRRADTAALDIAHLAEEIEDLGRRDLRDVASYLARVLEHLIKLRAAPNAPDAAHWASEIVHFQASAVAAFTPGMRQRLDGDRIWDQARRSAQRFLARHPSAALSDEASPLSLDVLLSDDFDVDEALARFCATLDRQDASDRTQRA